MTKLRWSYCWQLDSLTLLKVVSTKPTAQTPCDQFLSYSKCSKCPPPAFSSLSTSVWNFRGSFVNLNCGKLTHMTFYLQCAAYKSTYLLTYVLISSPVRLSLQKLLLALDEAFKKDRTWYFNGIQIWRIRQHCFFSILVRSVRMQAYCWTTW